MEKDKQTILGQNLKDRLFEMYNEYDDITRKSIQNNKINKWYEVGKGIGALEAVGKIIFEVYGGEVAIAHITGEI